MNAEQFKIFQEETKKAIENTIRVVVNGKIDRMSQKLDDHVTQHEGEMNDLRPIIEAYRGSKVLGEMLKWLAIVGAAFLFLKSNFHL